VLSCVPVIQHRGSALSAGDNVSNISPPTAEFFLTYYLALAKPRVCAHGSELFFMAKTSWKQREKRKRKTVEKYAELRAELKKKGDYLAISQLPRNASPVRLSNRCRVSGRKRAFLREFQMSRLTFRELASAGMIPGVHKASW